MRLLWEESFLGVVGAFCVAGLALGAAWIVLEGIMGLNGVLAGLLATGAAVGALEAMSRRRYAPLPPPTERPSASTAGALPGESGEGQPVAPARRAA